MTNVKTSIFNPRAAWQVSASLFGFLLVATQVQAAPPGDLTFGVYDPEGVFSEDYDVSIEHLFLPWEDVFLPSLLQADAYARSRGRSVLVTIEPWTWNRSERNNPESLIEGITSGEYDQYMAAICSVLNVFESPVTVRWAQEMDDASGQFIWANWEPAQYVSAYQRMVDICRAKAPEINYLWSPLGYANLAEYYPGDDYVDLVGVSVFGLQDWEKSVLGQELSFADILRPRYERVEGFGKPVIVAELGYSGDEAYMSSWAEAVRADHAEFPNLVAVVYFNQKEVYPWPNGFGMPDWKMQNPVLGY